MWISDWCSDVFSSVFVSELYTLGLETIASTLVNVPRLAAAPVSMDCRLHEIFEFGRLQTQLIVGEVVAFHIRDEFYSAGKIDSIGMRPIARLGGPRKLGKAAGGGRGGQRG